ncbi:DNA/RNA nuclease SfsA [Porcipelethomonas sp.]|uniref:DNA/RNA nuclease SfsA n=1 Tax=Porcipelethomonas sp. TaxID=2981675 RepID=UPI003EF0F793
MKYKNIVNGKFISRPNRFIAKVCVNGLEETVHVKNTGRCRELLVPGAEVILERAENENRKTKYDLISVYKDDKLINMDSQAPNKIACELLHKLYPDAEIKPEQKYKNSRFDFFINNNGTRMFTEVKGVTLEENKTAMFPDAPTERGVKHIRELIEAVKEGYEAGILFIIQMKGIKLLIPNYSTHREFGEALKDAQKAGVKIMAYDCKVSENEVTADMPVRVNLEEN